MSLSLVLKNTYLQATFILMRCSVKILIVLHYKCMEGWKRVGFIKLCAYFCLALPAYQSLLETVLALPCSLILKVIGPLKDYLLMPSVDLVLRQPHLVY